MLIEFKNGKFVRYIRENWTEYLWVFVGEGEARPRFFLPVQRDYLRRGHIAWFMPFAPFAVLYIALQSAFLAVWNDLVWIAGKWKETK